MAPRRNIPKAARRFVWRLAIFYGLGSLAIGVIVPRTNKRLLSPSSNAAASPFVIGIQLAGIHVLNHIINAAILTSAWSAGNAFVYSGSRVLYSMALNGQAPWFFKRYLLMKKTPEPQLYKFDNVTYQTPNASLDKPSSGESNKV